MSKVESEQWATSRLLKAECLEPNAEGATGNCRVTLPRSAIAQPRKCTRLYKVY